MSSKIIGISGVAGSGKDLFYNLLKDYITCERFAIADELKIEIRDFILNNYSIDVVNCYREEKNLIRPYLVAHGVAKRTRTQGRYWIEKVESKIKQRVFEYYCLQNKGQDLYPIITDVRYDKYKEDEVFWLKKQMNGLLVHISLFEIKNGKRIFKKPINSDEASENPKLLEKADYIIEWQKIEGDFNTKKKALAPIIKDFIKFIK